MLAAPARADWAVKRQSREPLIDQIARELEAHPAERQLATRLARAAPKATLERLLASFAARASRAPGRPGAAARIRPAAAGRGACPRGGRPRSSAAGAPSKPGRAAAAPSRRVAARRLRRLGDGAAGGRRPRAGVAIYQRALGIEKRPAERRRLLHLLVASAGDPQQMDSEVAARRELARSNRAATRPRWRWSTRSSARDNRGRRRRCWKSAWPGAAPTPARR